MTGPSWILKIMLKLRLAMYMLLLQFYSLHCIYLPLYRRILRHSPLAASATDAGSFLIFSLYLFLPSSFIFFMTDLYLWQTFFALVSWICWKVSIQIVFIDRSHTVGIKLNISWKSMKPTFKIHCMCKQSSSLNVQSWHETV